MAIDQPADRRDEVRVDELTVAIGRGPAEFARARAALIAWKQFDIGWVEAYPPNAPIVAGTVVAVLIRHLGFWSLNGCRVVYEAGSPTDGTRFGYAYGTLINHAEAGEELFEIFIDPATEVISYRIRATSWPRATLAKLGQPSSALSRQGSELIRLERAIADR